MISEAIKDAIKRSLPQEVGTTLREVLEQAELNATEVISLRRANEILKSAEWRRNKMQDTANDQKDKALELQNRETALAVKEGQHAVRRELFDEFMEQYNLMWAQAFACPEARNKVFSIAGTAPTHDQNGIPMVGAVNLAGEIKDK